MTTETRSANTVGILKQLRSIRMVFPVVSAMLLALTAFISFQEISVYLQVTVALHDGTLNDDLVASITEKEAQYTTLYPARITLALVVVLTWLTWLYMSSRLLHAAGIKGLEYSPRMAAIWNVVPIMHLWMRMKVNVELASASSDNTDWKQSRPPQIAAFEGVTGSLSALVGAAHARMSQTIYSLDEWLSVARLGFAFEIVIAVALITSNIFMRWMYVRQSRLVEKASDRLPDGQPSQTTSV